MHGSSSFVSSTRMLFSLSRRQDVNLSLEIYITKCYRCSELTCNVANSCKFMKWSVFVGVEFYCFVEEEDSTGEVFESRWSSFRNSFPIQWLEFELYLSGGFLHSCTTLFSLSYNFLSLFFCALRISLWVLFLFPSPSRLFKFFFLNMAKTKLLFSSLFLCYKKKTKANRLEVSRYNLQFQREFLWYLKLDKREFSIFFFRSLVFLFSHFPPKSRFLSNPLNLGKHFSAVSASEADFFLISAGCP